MKSVSAFRKSIFAVRALRRVIPGRFAGLGLLLCVMALAPTVALIDNPLQSLSTALAHRGVSTSIMAPLQDAPAPAPIRQIAAQQTPDPSSQSALFAITDTDLSRQGWSWSQAKSLAARVWEAQRPERGVYTSFYCGCDITRRGSTGGDVDLASCGYVSNGGESRAKRLEWEHVMPAARIGEGRSCWVRGAPQCVRKGEAFAGRDCCEIADPIYAMAASDPVNLTPAIGEVNGDRSNYEFGLVPQSRSDVSYGQCQMKIDRSARTAEPPAARRGDIARIYAYMSTAYRIPVTTEEAVRLRGWMEADPVSAEEIAVNRAIRAAGHLANPFVLPR